MYTLSQRLKTIASLVPLGASVCDIGTDHGYLSIYLKDNNIANKVIATDIREKPLKNAQNNIAKSGVLGIETRLCDGLSGIKENEVNTVIIAGMGGDVIAGILDCCEWVKNNKEVTLILQPMTSPEQLRRYLKANSFKIESEIALCENNKIYSVLLVKYTTEKFSVDESYYYIGEVSPFTNDGLLYIKKQYNRCLECAKALESIPNKQSDYLLFKQALNGIKDKLNSITECE